jgi:small subunit ribosomal protein S5
VVEAAGIRNLLTKAYGSNNPVNVVKATFQALSELVSLEDMARRRGMTPHELHMRRMRREPEPEATVSETTE